MPSVRKATTYVALTKEEFRKRFLSRFCDPKFDALKGELDKIVDAAYDGYIVYRKNPQKAKAGKEFQNPDALLPVEWLEARANIAKARQRHDDKSSPRRLLVVNGSSRSEHSCPGEVSKTYRLAKLAEEIILKEKGFECDFLDLSLLTSEYGRVIYPCKACVSTSMPLCHFPCSCYPNFAMGQTGDWMNELYPRWIAAHGVMILCPVNWYQVPSTLKLMIDRLVCADGGNPDPTTTDGKDPMKAKELELKGWHYPKHLAGRAFSVVVHGDAAGVETLRRILCDWLSDMKLIQAGRSSVVETYLGYYKPYATSHDDLDADRDLMGQVQNAARSLIEMVKQLQAGTYRAPDEGMKNPLEK